MPYWLNFIVVFCSACVLIGCAPGSVPVRLGAVNVPTVLPAPTKTEAGAPMPEPTTSSQASIPIVPGRGNQMEDLQLCILGHWIHSHEEDAQGLMVYRPANYNFPPSRGRRGFDFREGGELIYFGISRTDGSEQFSGSWVIEGSNRVRINVNTEHIQPFVLQVVSYDDQALKVRLD